MKSLSEYNLCKLLKNNLISHIEIDDYFLGLADMYMYERHGSFNNSLQIAEFIYDNMCKNIDENEIDIDISQFNTFIKLVYLTMFDGNEVQGAYDMLDNDTMFMDMFINRSQYEKDHENIIRTIIHEMLHAYEDYNLQNNTGKSISSLVDNSYRQATKYVNYEHDNNVKIISRCIYLFNEQEQHAYFSQLRQDITNIINNNNIRLRQPDRYKIIVDKLSDTFIWKKYAELAIFVINIDNVDERTISNYNKFIKKNFNNELNVKNWNDFKKNIKKQYKKFKNRFDKLIPKIIFDVLSEEISESQNKKIIIPMSALK